MKKIIYVLLIIAVLAAGYGIYNYEKKDFVVSSDIQDEVVATSTEVSTTSDSGLVAKTMKVKIALLAEQTNTADKKDFRGCDLLVMQEREVPYSEAPLDAALKELFSKKDGWQPGKQEMGNYIASEKDLSYERVTITDGIAKIYMTGKIGPSAGVCDDVRLKTQLEETALQFPSVKSVEFYVNNVKNALIFSEKGE